MHCICSYMFYQCVEQNCAVLRETRIPRPRSNLKLSEQRTVA